MAFTDRSANELERIDTKLHALQDRAPQDVQSSITRWRTEAAATRFHLRNPVSNELPITVILGGTGTGKSTLVNRIVDSNVSAASFRRTFTAGPVAVCSGSSQLPETWSGFPHIPVEKENWPAKGDNTTLVVAHLDQPQNFILIDTPDLDGDQPAHHALADRAFRWAQRIVFVVTPEKYQMTELLPYYRLARRYGIPALFVMNKCEQAEVLNDFRRQLGERDWPDAQIFAIARDDAAFIVPPEFDLNALKSALNQPPAKNESARTQGFGLRVVDSAGRLSDQIIAPLREARKRVDALVASLRSMETPVAGVDVNPITQQLQRRLQQRSVLYLIGPQRILDRVRQVPTILSRLPRATWDWVMRGEFPSDVIDPKSPVHSNEPPDFPATLAEQFTVLRSRIDDLLRGDSTAKNWLTGPTYSNALLPPERAGEIATQEIDKLKAWLETRWNATPRDTRVLQAFIKYLPGGKKLAKWSEAAPYLLTIVLITHHAFFGHIDLLVLGGYSLATWLTEKISNEVSSRTRATNRKITDRFENLSHEQIVSVCDWLNQQAPTAAQINLLADLADALSATVEEVVR